MHALRSDQRASTNVDIKKARKPCTPHMGGTGPILDARQNKSGRAKEKAHHMGRASVTSSILTRITPACLASRKGSIASLIIFSRCLRKGIMTLLCLPFIVHCGTPALSCTTAFFTLRIPLKLLADLFPKAKVVLVL